AHMDRSEFSAINRSQKEIGTLMHVTCQAMLDPAGLMCHHSSTISMMVFARSSFMVAVEEILIVLKLLQSVQVDAHDYI
ncbi:hypothetical protein TELCIR_21037, partial [Teladorsagia circumcincta]